MQECNANHGNCVLPLLSFACSPESLSRRRYRASSVTVPKSSRLLRGSAILTAKGSVDPALLSHRKRRRLFQSKRFVIPFAFIFDLTLVVNAKVSRQGKCDGDVGDVEMRPESVKAAKARRNNGKGKDLEEYKTMCELKMEDLMMKEKLSNSPFLTLSLLRRNHLVRLKKLSRINF
ncbi:hypothetical protein YC2023_019419 [Brassica napus]